MAIAAVPDYMGKDFSSASPGLRFGMYLQVWGSGFAKEKEKVEPLKRAGKLNDDDKKVMVALLARQQASFEAVSNTANSVQLDTVSTSPFTTGLGNEHPLENGFAFLNPYGLPYLSGSGVKGVLRQAARELASGEWGDTYSWSDDVISALFGSEPGADTLKRGALTFWDVIPQIKGDSLAVEIMTPHQKHYYQEGQNPHDSGQPIPISFLTVPPGSGFTFHVQCNLGLLEHISAELTQNEQWKPLLQAAFAHAFGWLGFGAKTAVGYGQMLDKQALSEQQERARQEKLREAGIDTGTEHWKAAEIRDVNAGSGSITVANSDGRTASGKLYKELSDGAKKRLKKKKKVQVDVQVEIQGNLCIIQSINEVAP